MSRDSHNAAGPSTGTNKIVRNWNGKWSTDDATEKLWEAVGELIEPLRDHEWAMLVRLGLSRNEIEKHAEACQASEYYTERCCSHQSDGCHRRRSTLGGNSRDVNRSAPSRIHATIELSSVAMSRDVRCGRHAFLPMCVLGTSSLHLQVWSLEFGVSHVASFSTRSRSFSAHRHRCQRDGRRRDRVCKHPDARRKRHCRRSIACKNEIVVVS